jgi:hypothetical protein
MKAAKLFGVCLLIAACLSFAPGQSASGPEVKLTCLHHDEAISRHASYPITWTAVNIPANTVLSLRIQWSEQREGGRAAGGSWLIGDVFDAKTQKRFAALNHSTIESPTIESGKFLWNVDKFCRENRNGARSVCDQNVHYRLQMILRAADDPCADNTQCAKPRSLFTVSLSEGAFIIRD